MSGGWYDELDTEQRDYVNDQIVRGNLDSGPTWDTDALRREFEVIGFSAPYVVVRRRSDGVKGTLEFTHNPRVYFNWQES
jgi:hypothetical protein